MPNRSVRIPEDKLIEHIYPYMGQYITVEKRIASATTDYQEIELVWNRHLGNILIIDGIIQHTDLDECIYAELLAHVPLTCIGSQAPNRMSKNTRMEQAVQNRSDARRAKTEEQGVYGNTLSDEVCSATQQMSSFQQPANVLIVGGGDMGVMEEVLKHGSVAHCDLVDIDGTVIEFAKEHMRHIHKDCWRDPRVTITVGDGLDFLRGITCVYDAILVDGTDPGYPEMGNSLFTDEFFELARAHISDGGMFVIGSDVPFHHPQAIAPIQRRLRRLYGNAGAFQGTVPTFQGGVQLFAYGITRDTKPVPVPERLPPGLRYLNVEMLTACFALPEYIRRLVELVDVPDYQWRGDEWQ